MKRAALASIPSTGREASANVQHDSVKEEQDPAKTTDSLRNLTLDLILGGGDAITNSSSLPFSKRSFVLFADAFRLPGKFFPVFISGTPVYFPDHGPLETKFIMRTPLSTSCNWTMALCWNHSEMRTQGIIHGLQKAERTSLLRALDEFKNAPVHPLVLPVLLCELLTEADSEGIKRHASSLYDIEIQTAYMRIEKPAQTRTMKQETSQADDVEEITRKLNAVVSRLAFHEMRINANITLTTAVRTDLALVRDTLDKVAQTQTRAWVQEQWQSLSQLLGQRLRNLQVEHQALLLEIGCNQKIAAGQLQIVYNLIAQRDARENLRQAAISTEIARITREDGFAMRTIAVMTISFLPATAISSIFSMSMFNWQADPEAPVVSGRFWIYWVVAVPLTLVVMGLWGFWMEVHKGHEEKPPSPAERAPLSEASTQVLDGQQRGFFSRFPRLRRRSATKKPADVEIVAVEEPPRDLRPAGATSGFQVPSRTPTFVQGPLR